MYFCTAEYAAIIVDIKQALRIYPGTPEVPARTATTNDSGFDASRIKQTNVVQRLAEAMKSVPRVSATLGPEVTI
jgi:hypothetical protein